MGEHHLESVPLSLYSSGVGDRPAWRASLREYTSVSVQLWGSVIGRRGRASLREYTSVSVQLWGR